MTVTVVAKQWMWKAEHPEGQREINALHLPVNRPVQLRMTSEDVIHDFGLPDFRIKHDVLPGRYETMNFTPTKTGTLHALLQPVLRHRPRQHGRPGDRHEPSPTTSAGWR